MSFGERIKLARKAKAMSQRDLAEKAGISAMSISKYERGENNPSSEILMRIAKALNEKVEYFFRPKPQADSLVLYRKHAALGKKELISIQARIQEWLERYIEIESLFPASDSSPFDLPSFPIATVEDVEKAAEKMREEWRLGVDPIDDLTEVLESRGIKIGLVECDEGFDACTFIYNGKPVIATRKKIPGDRQRFNIAHELGHIILKVSDEEINEPAAFRFAGAFLFPREAAYYELGKHRTNLGLRELYYLKKKFGLSMQAIVYRAKDLKIISKSTYKKIFGIFSEKGFRKSEPWEAYPSEIPMRMERLLLRLLAEKIITPSRAEELFKDKIDELGGRVAV